MFEKTLLLLTVELFFLKPPSILADCYLCKVSFVLQKKKPCLVPLQRGIRYFIELSQQNTNKCKGFYRTCVVWSPTRIEMTKFRTLPYCQKILRQRCAPASISLHLRLSDGLSSRWGWGDTKLQKYHNLQIVFVRYFFL